MNKNLCLLLLISAVCSTICTSQDIGKESSNSIRGFSFSITSAGSYLGRVDSISGEKSKEFSIELNKSIGFVVQNTYVFGVELNSIFDKELDSDSEYFFAIGPYLKYVKCFGNKISFFRGINFSIEAGLFFPNYFYDGQVISSSPFADQSYILLSPALSLRILPKLYIMLRSNSSLFIKSSNHHSLGVGIELRL